MTERITSQSGRSASESTTEITGPNYSLDAAGTGPKKERQLLRKERLADGNLFFSWTAPANGRPLNVAANALLVGVHLQHILRPIRNMLQIAPADSGPRHTLIFHGARMGCLM